MGIEFGRVDRTTPMGGNLVPSGATFRTWAPRARAVYVVTDKELPSIGQAGWRPGNDSRLEALGDGTWGGFLDTAGTGCATCSGSTASAQAALSGTPTPAS
jgi:1,4-alpha-glucan branching enzyme